MDYQQLLQPTVATSRIQALIEALYKDTPEIESERAILVTESYQQTENQPMIIRRALALQHILTHMPIVIRPNELIVGNFTRKARSAQVFPEFSNQWLEKEFDLMSKRKGDVFLVSDPTKKQLRNCFTYWKGRTVNELARAYMLKETIEVMDANIFTVNNYFFNGVGHISVDYKKALEIGFNGIILEAQEALFALDEGAPDYSKRQKFLEAVILSSEAIISFAHRFSEEALRLATVEKDAKRRQELERIATICKRVPANGATHFYEALQTFWFVHAVLQIESNGHSISPMRFDQYMYPYYINDLRNHYITPEEAQELIDCIFVKLNEINKVRDEASTKAFGGYPLFQNLIVGGQTATGEDATNELSFMCLEATHHTKLPQPSLSIRVWENSPEELVIKAAQISRLGTGMPAYYNDQVIIPALVKRGLTLEDARDYGIIGCVEPQKGGKTEGWHDSGFVNVVRILESTLYNGKLDGKQVGPQTGELESFTCIEDFIEAYRIQMAYYIKHLANAENAVDLAHGERAPLPFVSSLVEDCIARGKSIQEGGAHYNFTGPQGVGVANVGDAFAAIDTLVFKEKKLSMKDLKKALQTNFQDQFSSLSLEEKLLVQLVSQKVKKELISQGKIASDLEEDSNIYINSYNNGEYIRQLLLNKAPKYGNDIDYVDQLTRKAALIYCEEVEKYKNPRGGTFQPGLYPASINVAMGAAVGATPDGRKSGTPLADGVSPCAGADRKGPTAVLRSVAKLNHEIASNGTLLNQKFHPSVLQGEKGLRHLAHLVMGYFDEKGMHVQFNVISRETLLKAKEHPEQYKHLVVRVAGYSAQFVSLDPAVQDDIINRTEQADEGV